VIHFCFFLVLCSIYWRFFVVQLSLFGSGSLFHSVHFSLVPTRLECLCDSVCCVLGFSLSSVNIEDSGQSGSNTHTHKHTITIPCNTHTQSPDSTNPFTRNTTTSNRTHIHFTPIPQSITTHFSFTFPPLSLPLPLTPSYESLDLDFLTESREQ